VEQKIVASEDAAADADKHHHHGGAVTPVLTEADAESVSVSKTVVAVDAKESAILAADAAELKKQEMIEAAQEAASDAKAAAGGK